MGGKTISILFTGFVLLGIWVWMHFAQSHLLIFFGGSHAQITIGDGSVEWRLVVVKTRNPRSLLDFAMMANSASYDMLLRGDCGVGTLPIEARFPNKSLPESLFMDEPVDPFSVEMPQPDPFAVNAPSVLATLVGRRPSFSLDHGGGGMQFILTVPYYVVLLAFSIAAVVLQMRNRKFLPGQGFTTSINR